MTIESRPRAETGPMQFEDDWRGVFIRGDNALMGYLPALRRALRDEHIGAFDRMVLKGLVALLARAAHDEAAAELQHAKLVDPTVAEEPTP